MHQPGHPHQPEDPSRQASGAGEGLQSSASKAKPRQRTYPGSEVLAGQSPRKVLTKILRGDPLGMDSRCADRVAHHANLVDPDRLYDHATAWVAHQAFGYDGTPPLDEFLTTCIDSTIRTLLDEDIEVQRQGIPALGDPDQSSTTSVSHWLADCLGIEPPIARKCAVVYNNLPIPVREAFWAVVIQSKPLERAGAPGPRPPPRARKSQGPGAVCSGHDEHPGHDPRAQPRPRGSELELRRGHFPRL